MIGDGTFRVLFQLLGYLYPGYMCYKDVQSRANDRLRLWCMYWVLMAAFTAVQPVTDIFLFFIPFYYSAKLAFACYLWLNNLAGADLVYSRYVQPFIAHYEPAVDGRLGEVKAVARDTGMVYLQEAKQWVVKQLAALMAQGAQVVGGHMRADNTGQAAPAAERSGSFSSALSGGLSSRSFSTKSE